MSVTLRPLINCPVCGNESAKVRRVTTQQITNALKQYYGEYPPRVDFGNYSIHRCKICSLEFSEPLLAGSEVYYNWLAVQPSYYPPNRWEWIEVIEKIKNDNLSSSLNILEVGCGNGTFLEKLLPFHNVQATGLDTSTKAVEICRSKGIEVYHETAEEFALQYYNLKYNLVCSFHCLEHVPNPLDFMIQLKKLLTPGGQIIISTPYSPMTFERIWFDPMNHPPHHMTRWNAKAYQMLASKIGMTVTLHCSPAANIKDRCKEALSFANYGVGSIMSTVQFKKYILAHPLEYFREYLFQQKRETIAGKVAGNAVLATFSS